MLGVKEGIKGIQELSISRISFYNHGNITERMVDSNVN